MTNPSLDPADGSPFWEPRRRRVALVTEGTYPGNGGGVSVWCDQMVHGLAEVDFQVVAITLNHREPRRWALPENARLANIPLWDRSLEGTEKPGRLLRIGALSDLARMVTAAPRAVSASSIEEVATATEADDTEFADIIDRLITAAASGDLARGLQYPAMCEAFGLAITQSEWLRDERHATLIDVARLAEAFVHILRPLLFDVGPVDVVQTSAGGLPILVALAMHSRRNIPFVLTEHGLYMRERYLNIDEEVDRPAMKAVLLRFYELLTRLGYRRAAVIAPVSEFNRGWQLRMGADDERVRLIRSAVDPSDFPVRLAEPDRPSISWLGRIDPIKDIHTLIRAAGVMHDRRSDVVIELYGSATTSQAGYLASCHSLIEELDLGEVVLFKGRVDHAMDAFHAGQISALSSISEGFPYSVLESMACGVPVVGTDVGGVAEAIGAAGRCVPARDHEAMAAACLELLGSRRLRRTMGLEARQRVEQQFNLRQMLDIHLDLYGELSAWQPTRSGAPGRKARSHRSVGGG